MQQRDSVHFLHALRAQCLRETQGVWQGAALQPVQQFSEQSNRCLLVTGQITIFAG